MNGYIAGRGYDPRPAVITLEQAKRVAAQYSSSGSLLVFSFTGEINTPAARRALLKIIGRLYDNVKRGKGYCLHRSQLANLRAYVYSQKGTSNAQDHTQVHAVGHRAHA